MLFSAVDSGDDWSFNAFSYNASTGVTTGKLAGAINLYTPSLGGCGIGLDGTALSSFNGKVRFQYHNADAQLDLPSTGADLKPSPSRVVRARL